MDSMNLVPTTPTPTPTLPKIVYKIRPIGPRSPYTSIPCSPAMREKLEKYRREYEEMYGRAKNWDAIFESLLSQKSFSLVGMV